MCLILLAWRHHPGYRLILAHNRDEFYARPAAPATFWAEAPELLAGRDLAGGGTWLGVTRGGRVATVANFRDPSDRRPGRRSRGSLPLDFLLGAAGPADFLQEAARRADAYRGFNLLAGDGEELAFLSSREGRVRPLAPGVHGFSNGPLAAPWPKVAGGRAALAELLSGGGAVDPEALFALLADTSRPADALLPDTGVGLERERLLAPRFIVTPAYGTRASTVLLVRRDGRAVFVERTFDRAPQRWREVRFDFRPRP